ncbi:MAG: 30S ribosomal protein S15 [Candidatus Njordarchaeota archaeon]
MAKLYARRRGKAQSKRLYRTSPPTFVKLTPQEIEHLIIDLARKGEPPAKIGLILRDQYGMPSVRQILGKKLCEVLEENDLLPEIPEDLMNLIRKALTIRKHLMQHRKDIRAKRSLQLVESKINRLIDYYKNKNRLPAGFSYYKYIREMQITL